MFAQLFERIDWIDPSEPITLIAPLVAAVAALALTHPRVVERVGRDAAFWRRVRGFLPAVDDEARERGFYTNYAISKEEFVGVAFVEDVAELEDALRDVNFRLSPLAAHKETPDGRREVGSWGRYGGIDIDALPWPLSALVLMAYPRQLHLTPFDGRPEDLNSSRWGRGYGEAVEAGDLTPVLVTGHREKNPYNPVFALRHLRGVGHDTDAGVEAIAELLVFETDVDFAPSNRAIALAGDAVSE